MTAMHLRENSRNINLTTENKKQVAQFKLSHLIVFVENKINPMLYKPSFLFLVLLLFLRLHSR